MNKSDGLVADSEGSYMLKLLDLVYGGGTQATIKCMQCNKTNSGAAKRSNTMKCLKTVASALWHLWQHWDTSRRRLKENHLDFFFLLRNCFLYVAVLRSDKWLQAGLFFCRKQTETGFRGQIGTIIWTPGMWEKETGCQKTDVVAMARWRSLSSVQIHLCLWATIWRGINLACMRRSLWGYSVFKTCLSVLGFFIY